MSNLTYKKFNLLFLLTFLFFYGFAQKSNYVFENFGIAQGLSQSTVNGILQDKKGFLWFSTQDGLNKYDGYTFKSFRPDFENPKNSLPEGINQVLTEDNFGNIVVGTLGGGVSVYSSTQQKFYHWKNEPGTKNSIAGNNIYQILIDKKNTFWIMHENGFSKFTFPIKNNFDSVIIKNSDRFFGKKISEMNGIMIGFIPDKNKNLFFLYKSKLFFIDSQNTDFENYNADKLPAKTHQISIDIKSIMQFGTDRDKNTWILYIDRLEKIIDVKTNKKEIHYLNQKLDRRTVNGFFVGSDSCVYIYSNANGINSINLKTNESVIIRKEDGNSKSLLTNGINYITEDSKGNIWIGTSGGISKYNPKKNKFRNVSPKPENKNWLQDAWVFSFGEDKNSDIWVGTGHGKGIYVYNKRTEVFRNIMPANAALSVTGANNIMAILRDRDGIMWIGTLGGGLGKYNEKTNSFTFYTSKSMDSLSISNNYVNALAEDKDGYIWVATLSGLNKFDKKSGKFHRYSPIGIFPVNPPNPENIIQSVNINADGSLWIGTSGAGLQKLCFDANGKPVYKKYLSNLSDSSTLSLNQIFHINNDKHNNLWIATIGGGLDKFDPKTNKFKRYTVKNGLANNFIYGVLIDEFDRIWASTNYGLSVLNTNSGKFTNYTINHGLQSNEFNQGAFFVDSEGLMYFGGINGYNVFKPSAIQLDTSSAQVVFTDFKIFNKSVVPGANEAIKQSIAYVDEINLNYSQRDFSFEFATNNYNSPSDNQFAYMIENYHNDWVNIGNSRTISFTGFPHGEYVLKVKASNADGVWSNTYSSIKIVIKPPFWKTLWFNTLMVIVLIVSVFFFIHLRTRKLIKDKQILEQKVRERTAKIEKQKNEILEKNEELNQLNEEISTQRDNLQELNEELTIKNDEILLQANEIHEKNEELNQLNDEISSQRDNLQEFNEELTVKNEEILTQKNEIEIKNTSITASIQYALRIQKAVLPTAKILIDNFKEHFVFLQPRDIVSGDFYYAKQEGNQLIIAVADCTGHGVPGAFMSMLGITLLNEIIRKKEVSTAAQVLDQLREYIKKSLQQTGKTGEQQDGMDIAFCAINTETLEMSFAGAHNPCWIVRNYELGIRNDELQNEKEFIIDNSKFIILEADHMPVGVYLKEKPFTEQKFQLQKGDTIYLFSDGYPSQFGGKRNLPLKSKYFKELLSEICNLPMNEQHRILETKFIQWKGDSEQTDDVLVLGVKI